MKPFAACECDDVHRRARTLAESERSRLMGCFAPRPSKGGRSTPLTVTARRFLVAKGGVRDRKTVGKVCYWQGPHCNIRPLCPLRQTQYSVCFRNTCLSRSTSFAKVSSQLVHGNATFEFADSLHQAWCPRRAFVFWNSFPHAHEQLKMLLLLLLLLLLLMLLLSPLFLRFFFGGSTAAVAETQAGHVQQLPFKAASVFVVILTQS